MVKIRVYPYKQGSAGAKALAQATDGKVLKLQGSKYRPKAGDVVVNWGAGNVPNFGPARVLNKDVSDAQCKLKTFQAFAGTQVRAPQWTTNKKDAKDGVLGFPVVCRTKLRGHSGDGIVLANNADEVVDAPLYTKYVKKKDEYRVHVMGGAAFFIQRKARRLDVVNPNWQIRNLDGGFVFVQAERNEVPAEVLTQAAEAIKQLDLDFGGVDVIWNDREGAAYVLEVNTACGLEDRTAQQYSEALVDYIQNR